MRQCPRLQRLERALSPPDIAVADRVVFYIPINGREPQPESNGQLVFYDASLPTRPWEMNHA